MSKQRVIMHIDADAFFVSVEQGFNPQLRGKPVIVGGTADQRGVAHTVSYEARQRGVKIGMALVKAKVLCPDGIFLKGDYAHYKAVGDVFQDVYLNYTPSVEFTSLDDAYLDLSGTEFIHSSPCFVARMISDEVAKRVGVSISIGVGSSKLVARIASGLHKPRGIFHVTAEHEKKFLQELSVDHLPGVGKMAKEKLTDLHIFKVGKLARLPRLVVEQLFGKNGIRIWQMANGIDERQVEKKVIPRQLSRETSFSEDTADTKMIKGSRQYLTERIARKLREDKLNCQTLGVKLAYSDFRRIARSKSLMHSSNDSGNMFRMVESIFSDMTLRRIRIRHVEVSATNIRP